MNTIDRHFKMILDSFNMNKWENYDSVKDSYFDFLREDSIEGIKIKRNIDTKAEVGASKIGGTPDLPKNIEWPKFDNKPMVFLSQLNLFEMEKYHNSELFPKKGILYFFAYFPEPENEFGAEFDFFESREKYKVLFYEGNYSELNPTEFPTTLISD